MIRRLAVPVLCLFILAACGSPSRQSSSQKGIPVTAKSNKDDTLHLIYWQAPTILNPHLSNGLKDSEASRITLEPLASFDKTGNIVLFLAAEEPTLENGGVAKDGKSVIWKLKQNVQWSDGTPFKAEDVVFTYEFVSNPDVGATTAGAYELVESVEAIDDYTVKVNFKQINPAWFLVFMGVEGMILPKHMFEAYNGRDAREAPANLMPVGTGPFQAKSFKPGNTVIYQPNPRYRDIDTLSFRRIELKGGGDATSAARAVLQTGDADFAYGIQVEAPILKQLEAAAQGQVVTSFGARVERILINFTNPHKETKAGERASVEFLHPFFNDPQVRQAFNLTIDRDTIATQLYGPTGKATANFLVAPESYQSSNTSYSFDLEKAAALLDQAGWKDTNDNGIRDKDGMEMKLLFQTSVNSVRQKTQEIIKQALESIEIKVELKSIDPSIYFASNPANTETNAHFYADLQMFMTGNTNPDPGAYMKTYTCDEIAQKTNNWSKGNYSRYCNPDYDRLWRQATTELNPEKRRQLFIQMNDLLVKEAIVFPLVHRADTAAVSKRLVGVDPTPWDLHTWNIADWRRP